MGSGQRQVAGVDGLPGLGHHQQRLRRHPRLYGRRHRPGGLTRPRRLHRCRGRRAGIGRPRERLRRGSRRGVRHRPGRGGRRPGRLFDRRRQPAIGLADLRDRQAVERVRAAVEGAKTGSGLVSTAEAENFIRGNPDLADTIVRLQAYQEAGADVLYAPGLSDIGDIRRVVAEVDRPVNVLARAGLAPVARTRPRPVSPVSPSGGRSARWRWPRWWLPAASCSTTAPTGSPCRPARVGSLPPSPLGARHRPDRTELALAFRPSVPHSADLALGPVPGMDAHRT